MVNGKPVVATGRNLHKLMDLPPSTVIHAFKVVRANGAPPAYPDVRPKLRYVVGRTIIERNCDTDTEELCGSGLNVATLRWCLETCYGDSCNRYAGDLLITVAFKPSDIGAVPRWSQGKFRVRRLTVISAKPMTAPRKRK